MMGMIFLLLVLFLSGAPAYTPAVPGQPVQPTEQSGSCSNEEISLLGVARSTDHGATWTFLGNACMRDSTVGAVDPTPVAIDGGVALYFVDIYKLNQPTPQIIYRATSVDGVNFDKATPAYTQSPTLVDPFVLRMPDASLRVYVPSEDEGIISATSADGLVFTRDYGVRMTSGGMPGALVLPDNRVRLFLCGSHDGQEGIFSMISSDGLNFADESGLRIQAPANSIADNPEPIRLADGSYLMLFQIHDKKDEALPPWERNEMRLATSTDGYDWITNPTVIGYGGTSCIVELADGTLVLHYVDGVEPSAITNVTFNGTNKLVINGVNFGDNPSVFINKVDRTSRIRSAGSAKIVLKKKLGLQIPGSNLVEVKTRLGTSWYTLVL
jgi:hypothetical protein